MTSVVNRFSKAPLQQGLRALFALRSTWLLVLAFCLLSGCDRAPAVHTLSGPTMGTTWSVKVVGLPVDMTPPQLQHELQLILQNINQQMSTYIPDSDISRFNQADAGTWHTLPADFYQVLDYALRLADETDGAYDPTVGPLVNLWGFGPDKTRINAPSEEQLAQARARIGWQRITLDADKRAALQPGGIYVDLSSVAKGYAVDKLADYLAARGLTNYLVEIGGELRANGQKPEGNGWRVAVERPVPGIREVERVLTLSHGAVATSGDYRNFFEQDGQFFAHIINPHTGQPVDHLTASVTVLADTCTEADALATALTVLGPEVGIAFAEARQLAVLFIVRTETGFAEIPSSAFKQLSQAQQEH
ncbi:MAG: FAD:protein FMN transferase [Alcanivoracaceae bacterium]|nr:FAD:protein FMN transferase [Alcanivoracaceae bacterium]